MGNAVVIINHPTSLDHGVPMMDGGEVTAEDPGMIRLEKDSGTEGCGGTITFKRTVKECGSSHTIASERGTTMSAGVSASCGLEGPEVSASAGIEKKDIETRKGKTHIEHIVTDRNDMSELDVQVNMMGKNKGKYKWLSNDLRLKATHRWSRNSELFIKITFREEGDSDADSVVDAEYKEITLDGGEEAAE